ncbi:MAG: peptide chain release factor N(5)-glutamine methyltransferase [Candidatus Saccharibacteria bacterium]|nr:peptide chain release factor N(5)-glutamine methyltransferase [Candidatus Saccharibacteria bacterium]
MIISEWLKQCSNKIDRLDAELILVDFLGASDRSYLVSHADDELSNTTQIDAQVDRRADGEPLAYILGHREFYGRNFFVTPDVLIPRPETETIIDIVKQISPASIMDVGTGSGCIAITLSLELPEASINAVDISDDALRIAQKNAAHHGARVQFHKSNLLNDYKPGPGTLIIANLPYVDREWDWLDHQSLDHEPSLALYAEQGGLALIYQLIDQYPENCSGLILEADTSQHDTIIKYAREHGLELVEQQGFILYFK